MKNIWVVIVNFNGGKDTVECITSLKKLHTKEFETKILIVDNNSHDDSVVRIRKEFPDVSIVENKANLGFTGGVNIGIANALQHGADYILLLNNDTLVDKDMLVQLMLQAEENPQNGIISPKIYFAKGSEYHKDRYTEKDYGKVIWYAGGKMDWQNIIGYHVGVDEVDKGQYDTVKSIDFASGCCMLIKKSVFEVVGVFDQRYFLYYEDSDFSERAKRKKFKILYVPKAIMWHKNAGSAGGSGSALQDYYITRNRLLFGSTYASFRSKIALLRESLHIYIKGRVWQKRGVCDFYLRRFGRGSFHI